MTGRSISKLRLGTTRPPGVRGLATFTRPVLEEILIGMFSSPLSLSSAAVPWGWSS